MQDKGKRARPLRHNHDRPGQWGVFVPRGTAMPTIIEDDTPAGRFVYISAAPLKFVYAIGRR